MNEWISVEDRLPDEDIRVLVYLDSDRSYTKIDTDRRFEGKWVRWGSDVTHWMYLPESPTDNNELSLVNCSTMLWVGGEPFRCYCGSNVFSEYKTNDGKKIFECHGCKSRYEGQ